jgi:hypothetical protein
MRSAADKYILLLFRSLQIFKTENELVCGGLLLGMPFVIATTESMKIPAHDQVSYARKFVGFGYIYPC